MPRGNVVNPPSEGCWFQMLQASLPRGSRDCCSRSVVSRHPRPVKSPKYSWHLAAEMVLLIVLCRHHFLSKIQADGCTCFKQRQDSERWAVDLGAQTGTQGWLSVTSSSTSGSSIYGTNKASCPSSTFRPCSTWQVQVNIQGDFWA